jgi:hypothetical protein
VKSLGLPPGRSIDVVTVQQRGTLLDSALTDGNFHFRGDVYESAAGGEVEPELFAVGFHEISLGIDGIAANLLYFTRIKEK